VDDDIWDDLTDPNIGYYDRQGRRISLRQWGQLRYGQSEPDYARIGDTMVGRVRVSTVWLGLDHHFGDGPPIIFETMVFGGVDDQAQERYCTEAEAIVGHEHWVRSQRRLVRWRRRIQRGFNQRFQNRPNPPHRAPPLEDDEDPGQDA
jgi:hypothetical protein